MYLQILEYVPLLHFTPIPFFSIFAAIKLFNISIFSLSNISNHCPLIPVQTNWREHIVSTPDVLRGKPRIKGTRISVSLILGYLAKGNNAEEIIREFPDITKEQITACLYYARELSEFEVAVL